MLPDSDQGQENRRGCYVMAALLALALLLLGWLATRASDTQQSNEALSQSLPS
jgi:hypothetical protein